MDGEKGEKKKKREEARYARVLRREHGETWLVQSEDMVSSRTNDEALFVSKISTSHHRLSRAIFFFFFQGWIHFAISCDSGRHLFPLKLHWSRPANEKMRQTFNMIIGTPQRTSHLRDTTIHLPSSRAGIACIFPNDPHIHTKPMISDYSPCVHR